MVVFAGLLLTGCAGINVKDDGSIEAYGFLRTVTVKEELYESGKLKSKTMSTESTTKDVLLGINELMDTAVNTAAKIKP